MLVRERVRERKRRRGILGWSRIDTTFNVETDRCDLRVEESSRGRVTLPS